MFAKVRTSGSDPTNGNIIEIQKIQNKWLRMLTNTRLQDKVNTVTLLQATKMLSVNQINPQIKIQEIWKSLNIENYPIKLEKHSESRAGTSTRACTSCKRIKHGKSNISQKTCINDAVRSMESTTSGGHSL